ncbi:MAG: CHAT domain-containing protein [Myxococcota bacterium]
MRRVWVALWLWSAACGGPAAPETGAEAKRPAPAPAARPLRPLKVLFGGCVEPGPGPTCGLSGERRELTLWVDEPSPDDVRLQVDGATVTGEVIEVEHGLRWTLDIPPGATRLTVHRPSSDDAEAFSLALPTLEPEAVDGAEALRHEALAAYGERDLDAIEAVIDRARRRRSWSVAAQWLHSLAFQAIVEQRDLSLGRQRLDEATEALPYEDATHLYFRGLLAEQRGDVGEATVAYRDAAHQARALGAGLAPVLMLAVLGRTAVMSAHATDRASTLEAIEHGLAVARSTFVDDDSRASFLNSAAWSLLMLDTSPGRARALLERSRQLLGPRPEGRDAWFTVRLNLAYEALERGAPHDARRWLAPVADRRMIRANELWHGLLQARLERQQGAPEAAGRRLQAMLASADRLGDHGLRWAARVERARALEHSGRVPEALAEYAQADRVLEQQLPRLGMDDRERFLLGRHAVAQRRVELLLDGGDPDAALCVARLARTRALRSLDQRVKRDADPVTRRALDDYLGTRLRLDNAYDDTFDMVGAAAADRRRREIDREREANEQRFESVMRGPGLQGAAPPDCDALSRPPEGGLDLHFVKLERSWVGFAVDDGGTTTPRTLSDPSAALDSGDAVRLGQVLLEPFAPQLRAASRLRIMASGALYGVPFHALPLGADEPWLRADRAVVYGLDLPRVRTRTDEVTGAALVLEPPSNLPNAHEEAEFGISGLRRRGATVVSLSDDTSTTARVLAELPRASWLHYVGHARSNGLGGWDSELVLAADGTAVVGVADVLALPAVPSVAVLSGCQTGVLDPHSQSGGMSLAHAFLLAGSDIVVATTEKIRDDEALSLMRDFYEALDGLDDDAVSRALASAHRRAIDTERSAPPHTTAWHSVRAWVP